MKRLLICCGLLLACTSTAPAADRTFTVVTNAAVVNHWPSGDRLIGTADDVVSGGLSTYVQSSPNHEGSYSYIATTFGASTQPDPLLFDRYDAITFVAGSASIDPATFVTNDIPLLTGLQVSGTELFPGHGPYRLKVTNRRGGSSRLEGNVYIFSTRYDFEGTFQSGNATAENAQADGRAVLLDADEYDSPDLTGLPDALAAYVRTVALPLAKDLGARGLLCGDMMLQTAGSLPGSPGYFPPLTAYAVVLAMDLSAGIELSIQRTGDAVRLQWSAAAEGPYTVEAADSVGSPFAVLAEGLSVTEYTDPTDGRRSQRFYRVRHN